MLFIIITFHNIFLQRIVFDQLTLWGNFSLVWNNTEVYHYMKIMINKEDNYQNMPFRNDRHIYGSCKTKMISFSCTFYACLSYLMASVIIHYINSCKEVFWLLLTRQFITFRRKLYRQFCANRIRDYSIFSSSLWIHNCAFEISHS